MIKDLSPHDGRYSSVNFYFQNDKILFLKCWFLQVFLVTNADKYKHFERWATASEEQIFNLIKLLITDLQFWPRLKNINSLNYRTLEFFSTLAKKYLTFTIYYHDFSFKGLLYSENNYQPINSFHQKVIFFNFFHHGIYFFENLLYFSFLLKILVSI